MAFCTNSTLFLALTELGAGTSFYLLEGSFFILLLALVRHLAVEHHGRKRELLSAFWTELGESRPAAAAFGCYLLWDALGVFRSPLPRAALAKWKGIAFLLVLTFCLVYTGKDRAGRKHITGAAALAGLLVSVLALVQGLRGGGVYSLRLSLRTDYNMFALAVLTGLAAGTDLLLHCTWPVPGKLTGLLLLDLAELPVLWLSGSRRTVLALAVILPLLTALCTLHLAGRLGPSGALAAGSLLVVFTVTGTLLTTGLLQEQLRSRQELPGSPEPPGQATAAGDRYAALEEGKALGKRRLLWRIAREELLRSDPSQWIFGRGSCYDIFLYDESRDPELAEAYPDEASRKGKLSAHSLLLADLLNGGLLQGGLLLIFLGLLGAAVLRDFLSAPERTLPWVLLLGFAVVSSLFSNRYGLAYDRIFYLGWVMTHASAEGPEQRGGFAHGFGCHRHDGPSLG